MDVVLLPCVLCFCHVYLLFGCFRNSVWCLRHLCCCFCVFAISYLLNDNLVYNLVDNEDLWNAADSTTAPFPLELNFRSFCCLSPGRYDNLFVNENCCTESIVFSNKTKKWMNECYWNGRLGFDSRSGQTKHYKNWYSQLSFPAWRYACSMAYTQLQALVTSYRIFI